MAEAKYQTFWPRLNAGIIDGLIFVPLSYLGSTITVSVNHPTVSAGWFFIHATMYGVYEVVMHGLYGQTFGKRAMRVKVLDVSESPISWQQALRRNIVGLTFALAWCVYQVPQILADGSPKSGAMLPWFGQMLIYGSLLWSISEFVTMLMNPKRRAIHDFIAGTVVLNLSKNNGQNHSAESDA